MLDEMEYESLNKLYLPLTVAINKKVDIMVKKDLKEILPKKNTFIVSILTIIRNKIKGRK